MARVNKKKPFRPRCKYCRTNRYVVPIVYSQSITEELLQKEQNGEIRIGSLARRVEAPNWYCKNCESEFLR